MREKEFVEVPEQPNVEKFVFADKPGTIFINLSCTCKGKGVVRIVPTAPTDGTKKLA